MTQESVALQTVRAAIFGVGAPEALLVGVVALVVFGPKGLAQVWHGKMRLGEMQPRRET